MERERGRERASAENGGWILQSKKPSVTQGSSRGGGGGGGEGCDTVTAGWQTHGNDCVIYPSPVEPEGCVLDMKARIQ